MLQWWLEGFNRVRWFDCDWGNKFATARFGMERGSQWCSIFNINILALMFSLGQCSAFLLPLGGVMCWCRKATWTFVQEKKGRSAEAKCHSSTEAYYSFGVGFVHSQKLFQSCALQLPKVSALSRLQKMTNVTMHRPQQLCMLSRTVPVTFLLSRAVRFGVLHLSSFQLGAQPKR